MIEKKNQSIRFATLVNLPDFLFPWVDRFYEPGEIELIQLLNRDALVATEVKTRWTNTSGESLPRDVESFLERSYKRGILDRDAQRCYATADFHKRYDIWALFESWQDIPDDVRESLNQWELNDYISGHRRLVDGLKKGKPRDTLERWPEYLLPHEAETLIDTVDHVYLWPCNCRSMLGRCTKPIYTCLRFSNNRGIGGAICNCCSDCCFPHLLTKPLEAQKLWPLTRYAAHVGIENCSACGRCVRRCPFNAITLGEHDEEQEKPHITIDTNLCRGCGVCSTGCKETAISMVKLDNVDSLFDTLMG